MDSIQSKINVIEWLTDYRGHYYDTAHGKLVELRHKTGLVATMFTGSNIPVLLSKMDNFLDRKLAVIHKNRG